MHQEHSPVRVLSAQPTSPQCARLSEILRPNCEKARRMEGFFMRNLKNDPLRLLGMTGSSQASPFRISGVAAVNQ